MFKKLDKLISKAFIGPFVATFFITLLVLIMQFFWLWIDDFVGKGLDAGIILKFIWYQSAVLVPLALPLAVLLSSLMTFGNLGESFELVAIKSAGISLLRFMRPLFIIAMLISGVAFLFSNYVIPVAWLKSRTLLNDIVFAKPAFDIREGVFFDRLNGFAIKVGEKVSDSIIRDVIVYEQANQIQDNFITARSGVMRVSADKRYLEFNLQDGWRYQERGENNYGANAKTDFVRLGFKEYKKQFDLSAFVFTATPDSVNRNSEKVFSMRQLNVAMDSIERDTERLRKQLADNQFQNIFQFTKFLDSTSSGKSVPDSAFIAARSVDELIPDSLRPSAEQSAISQASSLFSSLAISRTHIEDKEKSLRRHKIEWHRKLVLSTACLLLFLVGAPLGSIIRKGGLGTPLIAAISFFMVFYFSTTLGEKFAKENSLTPFSGMWLSAFILLPIGIFLTYKAMHDSQLFNKEAYHRLGKKIKALISREKNRKRPADADEQ